MLALAIWIGSVAALYGPVLLRMARQWQDDVTYSHGWVIAPIALMLAWRQRDRLRHATISPSNAGLVVVVASLLVFVAGSLAAELFLTRISFIGVLAGTILYTLGPAHFKLLAFPLAFLVFMVPLPAIVFDRAAVSLQLVASALGERLIRAGGIPVLRDGNVLRLASISLEVDEACSGIRSLMALVSVTTLVGYLFEPIWWRRVAVAAAAIPLAIALNAVRIGLTGVAALRFGPAAARGSVHEATGMVVFIIALTCVCAFHLRGRRQPPRADSPRLEAA